MEPDAIEIRVLGCLIEKQRTTPDAYPLTLNALRLACNQSTNRDPVVDYTSGQIREALARLGPRRWTRNTSTSSSRVPKFRHLLDETLGLSDAELSLLAVLMLRGAQTPGELKQRTARMVDFASLDEVEQTLLGLYDRELVAALERRPGQKEIRWVQLIGGDRPGEAPASPPPAVIAAPPGVAAPPAGTAPPAMTAAAAPPRPAAAPAVAGAPVNPAAATPAAVAPAAPPAPDLRPELEELRAEVRALRADLDQLRADLGA